MRRGSCAKSVIAFLSFWLVFPPSLWSAPRLVIPPMGSVENEKARQYLADAFDRSEKVKVIALKTVDQYLLRSGSPEGAQEVRNQALRDFKEGEKAFKDLDLERAEEFWRKAKSAWESVAVTTTDYSNLRLAKYSLALALFGRGETVSARNELRELLIMDPDRSNTKLSQKRVPPAFVEEFEATRNEVLELPKGKLTVDSDPRGALVIVDGKSVNLTTEAEVFDLPVGRHFVVLKLEGFKTLTKSVLVNDGDNRMVEVLEKDQGGLVGRDFYPVPKGNDLSPHEIARLDEISRELNGDLLLFLKPDKGKVAAQFFDFRTTELSGVEVGRSPDETVEKLLRYLDSSGYVDTNVVKKREEEQRILRRNPVSAETPVGSLKDSMNRRAPDRKLSKGEPWYENYWIWVGIGAAVAAGGVGVWMLSNSKSNNSTLTVTIP